MTITLLITIALLFVGWKKAGADTRDYKASYGYMKQIARKQRLRADDLQRRLTVRVLEARALRRQLAGARQAVRHRPDVVEAIRLAATAYHVDFGLLYRRALCETGGTLNPYAKNPRSTASGVFQFLYPSTWNSTPYARESVWSPYANSMAAAWMESVGRGSEWVCR